MAEQRIIAVCGSTGNQGGAVVEALLRRGGFAIRALSRNLDGEKARALRARGVEVVRADLDDAGSLAQAFTGAHGVFAITQPWSADYRKADVPKEIAQGRHIFDACAKAGTKHLVFSSVMKTSDKPSGIPHVDSKFVIEKDLMGRSLPWTVLRPGTFMDNIGQSFFALKNGTLTGFTAGDAKLPFIACRDIGEAAAAVLEQGEAWLKKEIGLVGDYVSCDEVALRLSAVRGGPVRYKAAPALLMRLFAPEFYKMRRIFESAGRPPFPAQVHVDEALRLTQQLSPQRWDVGAYLSQSRLAAP